MQKKTKNWLKRLITWRLLLGKLAIVLTATSALLLLSCKALQPTTSKQSNSDTLIIREVLRDTVLHISADTASIKARLECDSLGQVYIKQINDLRLGKRTHAVLDIKQNTLTATCVADSLAIYLQLKDRYQSYTAKQVTIQTVELNRLSPWQWSQIWAGRAFFIILTIILILIIKKYVY